MKTTDKQIFVQKVWGNEKWIVNTEKYCGKLLTVNPGKHCSWHFHKIKDETFFIQAGEALIEYGYDTDIVKCEKVILKPGDSFYVPVGLIHRFTCISESDDLQLFEFSTQHFDTDSYRIYV